jgi:hypothetical protein
MSLLPELNPLFAIVCGQGATTCRHHAIIFTIRIRHRLSMRSRQFTAQALLPERRVAVMATVGDAN